MVVARTPGDEVVGLAWAWECEPATRHDRTVPAGDWELVQLAVLASYRGIGLAGRLLTVLTEVARDHQVPALHAQLVAATVGARELLERAGYTFDSLQLKLPLRS